MRYEIFQIGHCWFPVNVLWAGLGCGASVLWKLRWLKQRVYIPLRTPTPGSMLMTCYADEVIGSSTTTDTTDYRLASTSLQTADCRTSHCSLQTLRLAGVLEAGGITTIGVYDG